MDDRSVRELLAMEAVRTRYGTTEVPPAAATVEVLPDGTTGVERPAIAPADGTSAGTTDRQNFHVPQVNTAPGAPPEPTAGPPDNETPAVATASGGGGTTDRHLRSVRGAATAEIRSLIASGVTDVGVIRDRLAADGVKVPDASYVRRLVKAAREDSKVPGLYL
jgi:hypothetical protein